MSFLPHLDSDWRGETPEDFWLEMYHRASFPHQEMIREVMKRCGLTAREATQKIFKCKEEFALADTIPDRWNQPIFCSFTAQQITDIIGQDTMNELAGALAMKPDIFDDDIRVNRFSNITPDRKNTDWWMRRKDNL